MLAFRKAEGLQKQLLHDLLQRYLAEMARYYAIPQNADGFYEYKYFDTYFSDEARWAFFILKGDEIVGFALLNRHSHICKTPDHALAEFYILPEYRGKRIAAQTFALLCSMYPGKWEIKYSPKNIPAARLWEQATKPFVPTFHRLPDGEIVVSFRTDRISR